MVARQVLYPAVVNTLEQYDPARVRALIDATKQIAAELRPLLGNRLRKTPTTVQIPADDILAIAMERGGVGEPPIVHSRAVIFTASGNRPARGVSFRPADHVCASPWRRFMARNVSPIERRTARAERLPQPEPS